MKYILVFILFTSIISAQTDSTTVANSKLIELATKITQKTDSINQYKIITNLQDIQINKHIQAASIDSIEKMNLNSIVDNQEYIITILNNNKPKWYESKLLHFVYGALMMYGSAKLVSTIH